MRHIRKSNLLAVPFYRHMIGAIVDIMNFRGESAHHISLVTGINKTSLKYFLNGSNRLEPASLQKLLDYLKLDLCIYPKGQRSLPF